jgi:outer membrane protein insertion porin family
LNKPFTNKLSVLFLLYFCNCISLQAQKDDIQYEVAEISFKGNNSVGKAILEDIILTKESPGGFLQFLNIITEKFGAEAIYFDSLLLPSDIQIIKDHYWSQGFFEVEISSDYELNEEDKEAEITFLISENDPCLIDKIEILGFEGIDPFFTRGIQENFTLDTAVRYSANLVEENQDRIITYMKDNGFMLISSEKPFVKVDTMKNTASVKLSFDPYRRYKINEIRTSIGGPDSAEVEPEVLLQLLDMKKEDFYSYYKIQKGQVRLYRTGLFTSVLVSGIISDTVGNYVPILINADVGSLNELSPEIIVNNRDNAFNLGLGAQYTRKNFLGDARKFTLGGSIVTQDITELSSSLSIGDTLSGYADLRVGVEQPFLFGATVNTKAETYLTLEKRRNEYNSQLLGAKISLDWELPRFTFFNSLITFLNVERTRFIIRNLPVEVANLGNEISSINAFLGADFVSNRANNPLFPTGGYIWSISLEDGNLLPYMLNEAINFNFDNPVFYKILSSASFYTPFFDSKVSAFAFKVRAGHIQAYIGDEIKIPYNQRFYSGAAIQTVAGELVN